MITEIEEREVQPQEVDKIIYTAYNTVLNEPELSRIKFSFEEVFEFLKKRGYRIVSAKGLAKVTVSITNADMEVTQEDGGIQEVENVFALQKEETLPLDLSKSHDKTITKVFYRELKFKLLN